jgi:serine/threonine protein kinase
VKKPTPFGKYYLLERINVGGMAEVFRAKAFGVEGFERLVAVKRILPNIAEDKEFIRMFVDEAKLSVQLNHANIAQIFDLGVVDGAYYIALEHVHGRDLRGIFDRCRAGGEPMPVAQACFVVMKICEGLDYAHNKRDQGGRELQLVHRDVSPQNILVSFEGEVKLIDFGIAKAAGKGSKTQAGILKGKFGYMSPEQVRGLPIDRRSDVFSCGIVLYELLTGERLFVGESDFSTLEKVRNVEILPPSTYNRKIPDELERIVLKALAKDVDDRYQNAIDLHDELQAFVYTAGEFYSRKDLAGWMKKTFGKEIEEETAKLESYRQLKPPAPIVADPPPAVARTATTSKPPALPPPNRRSTQAMPSVSAGTTKPPPPPRVTGQMPAVKEPPAAAPAPFVSATGAKKQRSEDSGDLAWDDDELETQIYDNPEDDPKNKAAIGKKLPIGPGAPSPQPMAASADGGPDLSSLVSTAKGWEKGPSPASSIGAPVNIELGEPGAGATMNGLGIQGIGGSAAPAVLNKPPGAFPNGSAKVPAPAGANGSGAMPTASKSSGGMAASSTVTPAPSESGGEPYLFGGRELNAPARLVSAPLDQSAPFDPMASFGNDMHARRGGRGVMLIAIGGAAAAAVAVVVVIAMSGKKTPDTKPSDPVVTAPTPPTPTPGSNGSNTVAIAPTPTPPAPTPAAPADQNTGFDLYVTPGGITQWKLDGEARTDRLPSRIRGISPGPHTVQIDPPAGFMSQNQQVNVESGKAPKVEITLQPISGITGTFDSTPPGAMVSLIVDGKRQTLGPSPVKAPLDPRNTYQVLFEKSGYVSVNRPIAFSGELDERIVVNLERAGGQVAIAPPPPEHPTGPVVTPEHHDTPHHPPPHTPEHPATPEHGGDGGENPPPEHPIAKGDGTLMIGSKPPCQIFVDGSDTGLTTPQRSMKLSAGKHRITLINNDNSIKESFAVDIKADETTKAIKDYSAKMSGGGADPQ